MWGVCVNASVCVRVRVCVYVGMYRYVCAGNVRVCEYANTRV